MHYKNPVINQLWGSCWKLLISHTIDEQEILQQISIVSR